MVRRRIPNFLFMIKAIQSLPLENLVNPAATEFLGYKRKLFGRVKLLFHN